MTRRARPSAIPRVPGSSRSHPVRRVLATGWMSTIRHWHRPEDRNRHARRQASANRCASVLDTPSISSGHLRVSRESEYADTSRTSLLTRFASPGAFMQKPRRNMHRHPIPFGWRGLRNRLPRCVSTFDIRALTGSCFQAREKTPRISPARRLRVVAMRLIQGRSRIGRSSDHSRSAGGTSRTIVAG